MRFTLTVPGAIIIGAIIVGGAIAATPLVAPYRLIGGDPKWRLNIVTGEAVLCMPQKGYRGYALNCDYQLYMDDATFNELLKRTNDADAIKAIPRPAGVQ